MHINIYFKCSRSLCDINQHGKLDMEQFSLAMWLVERKLMGIDPPTTLSPEMIPPSNRTIAPTTVVQVIIQCISLFNNYVHVYICMIIKKMLLLYRKTF